MGCVSRPPQPRQRFQPNRKLITGHHIALSPPPPMASYPRPPPPSSDSPPLLLLGSPRLTLPKPTLRTQILRLNPQRSSTPGSSWPDSTPSPTASDSLPSPKHHPSDPFPHSKITTTKKTQSPTFLFVPSTNQEF
ncbi:hypothetical protein LOK49_LG09G01178 [Camellia lanceoleosa]|uniref:Uncharacterized protein n=1 Tax=Camellia lanceoleosa TaxID=1840588 RepID=A0ACC0GLM1_9ERIC|nr:hypothetical protein LOK49_LG09G01178 [Camellia lanceoleosa]